MSEGNGELRGKRVLVTGGVRRLGLHIAYAFAQRGARLGLNYHSAPETEATAARSRCLARGAEDVILLPGDITRAAEEVVAGFVDRFGSIDVLVNNAGVMPAQKSLSELSVDQLQQTLDLNLIAPFAMVKAAAPTMPRGSAIVNLASLGGVEIWKQRMDYNVSKSALITLTKALARELAPRSITVNAVAPGAIQVEQETLSIARDKIPMERYGTPEDIANAVLYFASAAYVTGQVLIVDGGRSVIG